MRVVLEGYRCLYSPRIREGFFSETGLPVYGLLGNSGHKKSRGCWTPARALYQKSHLGPAPSVGPGPSKVVSMSVPKVIVQLPPSPLLSPPWCCLHPEYLLRGLNPHRMRTRRRA